MSADLNVDEYQGWYFHPSQGYGQELSREETQEYIDNLNISHINETENNIHVWLETYGSESIMLEKKRSN